MTTYYEMLKIQPTASAAEVETAIQEQYDRWRRLVTHHDATVVNEANRSLAMLETIRGTLTNASRRSAYDAGIGLSGTVGGLADLDVILRDLDPTVTPPVPGFFKVPGAPSAATVSSSLWICPKQECKADNPPHTRFCFKCGTELVRKCPECGAMTSLVATQMCGSCGYNYEVATQRLDLKTRVSELQNETQGLKAQITTTTASKVDGCGPALLGIIGILSLGWGLFGSGVRLLGWFFAIVLLGGLIFVYSTMEREKRREVHDLSKLLEVKNEEMNTLEQEYRRLSLHKTGE